jgi:hypothetical protein
MSSPAATGVAASADATVVGSCVGAFVGSAVAVATVAVTGSACVGAVVGAEVAGATLGLAASVAAGVSVGLAAVLFSPQAVSKRPMAHSSKMRSIILYPLLFILNLLAQ